MGTRDFAESPMEAQPPASDCGSEGWGFEYCSARGWPTSSVDSGFIIDVRDRLRAQINP